jgi:hypothetical protein
MPLRGRGIVSALLAAPIHFAAYEERFAASFNCLQSSVQSSRGVP